MGWIAHIFGSIARTIFDPLISWIWSFLYSILIRGPLQFLNMLDGMFNYLSSVGLDRLLFSTSIVDGKPEINFFTSESVLLKPFLVILSIAGVLAVLMFGLSCAHSVSKGKGKLLEKGYSYLRGGVAIFAIPALFLVVLGFVGTLVSILSGTRIDMSVKDIQRFQNVLSTPLKNIQRDGDDLAKKCNPDKQRIWINNPKIIIDQFMHPKTDEHGKTYFTSSLNEIYSLLSYHQEPFNEKGDKNKKYYPLNDDVVKNADNVKSFYNNKIKKDIFVVGDDGLILNKNFMKDSKEISKVLNNLNPKMKDDKEGKRINNFVKNSTSYLENINSWYQKNNEGLLAYMKGTSIDIDMQEAILNQLKIITNNIYGDEPKEKPLYVSNLQDFKYFISTINNGDKKNINFGASMLGQMLVENPDSKLATIFYHISTGNKDNLWNRDNVAMKNNGAMLLMGTIMIVFAVFIMAKSVLFAVMRIIDLGLLFVVSPIPVITGFVDDHKRFSTWLNMVLARILSIFAMIISLRLFGALNDRFATMLEHSNNPLIHNENGYMIKMIFLGFFAIGGMLAAYKSSSTLSGILGAGYGIMDSLQGVNILRKTSAISRGLRNIGGSSSQAGRRILYGKKQLQGENSIQGKFGRRIQVNKKIPSIFDNVTRKTRGKIGSTKSKIGYFENKIQKTKDKKNTNKNIQKLNRLKDKKLKIEEKKIPNPNLNKNKLKGRKNGK